MILLLSSLICDSIIRASVRLLGINFSLHLTFWHFFSPEQATCQLFEKALKNAEQPRNFRQTILSFF
jgi:hypothetical protein